MAFGVAAAIISGGEVLLWRAAITIAFVLIVSVVTSLFTKPRKEEELKGLIWGTLEKEKTPQTAWWRGPVGLAIVLLVILAILLVVFA